ncbi:hypothetical protein F7725_003342 [Dissostichus mawsoni]|uniref:Elp3/MiaA/NifB-like radical SAM core domain-containing protein n=1 Tax=Dissostichus mawsoni TaxID=36200 RepID=A0A7J5YA31_DISMA|nr:hypothetical protein F7725_003342 [Dissostichus mawsoni]
MTECLQRETETLLQLSQVSWYGDLLNSRLKSAMNIITSVFFGGGTPSLAHPSTIAAVLETVSRQANLSDTAEVTLEVNPTPVGRSKLEDFFHAGVNRFSIGVQRPQPSAGFANCGRGQEAVARGVSVDVMFGRPKQSVESWENELSELLRVCDDHVSLYQLTLERGTQLFKQVLGGEVTLPTEEETAEMYLCARKTLHQHGLLQYEVSNFARQNAVSHHNRSYWKGTQSSRTVCPCGGGGVLREARTQTLEPDIWMREVQQKGHATRRRIQLSHLELLEEVLVMGMRMMEGINHKHWELFSPQLGLHEVFGTSSDVQELLQRGQLILDERGLRCSWEGLALLDSLLPALLVELERRVSQRLQEDEHAKGQTNRTSPR